MDSCIFQYDDKELLISLTVSPSHIGINTTFCDDDNIVKRDVLQLNQRCCSCIHDWWFTYYGVLCDTFEFSAFTFAIVSHFTCSRPGIHL